MAIPKFKGIQDQGKIEKAKSELRTLQTALESYYIHHSSYPNKATFMADLTGATPQMIAAALPDPLAANGTDYKYSVNGRYYAVWSIGQDRINSTGDIDASGNVPSSGDDIVMTNGTKTVLNLQTDANNCGAIGTSCPSGTCTNGACVSACTPNCTGKSCGNDGCGGSCGTCANGLTCSSSFACTDRSNGSPCNSNADCSGNYCDIAFGYCTNKAGSYCARAADCPSGYTCNNYSGVCYQNFYGGIGAPCMTGGGVRNHSLCSSFFCSTLYACSDRSAGSACSVAADCSSGHCVNGICIQGDNGNFCVSDPDCTSVHCDQSVCVASCPNGGCRCAAGLTHCGGICASLTSDVYNCGHCGTTCDINQGEICQNGACVCGCTCCGCSVDNSDC